MGHDAGCRHHTDTGRAPQVLRLDWIDRARARHLICHPVSNCQCRESRRRLPLFFPRNFYPSITRLCCVGSISCVVAAHLLQGSGSRPHGQWRPRRPGPREAGNGKGQGGCAAAGGAGAAARAFRWRHGLVYLRTGHDFPVVHALRRTAARAGKAKGEREPACSRSICRSGTRTDAIKWRRARFRPRATCNADLFRVSLDSRLLY